MQKYYRDVDLNLLQTFRAFVEEGSVSRAAEVLGRSQPAISARLKLLQSELGVRLLEPHGRRLRLTSAGHALERRLRPLLHQLTDALDAARASDSEPAGTLRLGVLPTAAVYVLAPRLAGLLEAHPRVDVEATLGLFAAHRDALLDGSLDAIMGVGNPPVDGLHVDRIGEARAVLVGRRGSMPSSPSYAELRAMRWVAFGRTGDAFFDAVAGFMERVGLEAQIAMRVAHIQTLKALIRAGVGVGILPDYTVVESDLVARRVRGLDVREPIWLAVRPGSVDTPLTMALRNAITADG